MLKCLQEGQLPAIVCKSADLPETHNPTLTELVTAAVYGASLLSGRSKGSLREALHPLLSECRVLWMECNGPGWMREHLKLVAAGKSWPFAPDTRDDDERITLKAFSATLHWLTSWRLSPAHGRLVGTGYGWTDTFGNPIPPPRSVTAELASKAEHLASMNEQQAIEYALAEADRIERDEALASARAADFYNLLSASITSRSIRLTAVAIDPGTGTWHPRVANDVPHQTIPYDYFELPVCHDLFDNELQFDRFSLETCRLGSILSRQSQQNDRSPAIWSDVKMPLEQANLLLSRFGGVLVRPASAAVGGSAIDGARPPDQKPHSAQIDPSSLHDWPIEMTVAWIIWRDLASVRECWATSERVTLFYVEHEATLSGRPRIKSFDEALAELRARLRSGELVASGVPAEGGSRVPIDKLQFVDLDFDPSVGSLTRASTGIMILVAYTDLRFERASVVRAYPAAEHETRNASLASAEKACKDWLIRQMRDWQHKQLGRSEQFRGRPLGRRSGYRTEAFKEFKGLSGEGFTRAWKQAIEATGAHEWSKPGRPPKSAGKKSSDQ